MDEDLGNQFFPMNTNPASIGSEKMGHSSAQSNHTSSNNMNQEQGYTLAMLSVEKQRSDNTVHPLSPTPSLEKLSRDSQMPVEVGKETEAMPSVVSYYKHALEAHKPTSPKKPINNPSHANEPTSTSSYSKKPINSPTPINESINISLSPKRRNIKRIARAQGRGLKTLI